MLENDLQFKKRLVSRIQGWREEGLIDEASAMALIQREGGQMTGLLAAVRLHLAIAALAILGAVAVGAGAVLFMAANIKAGHEFPAYVETAALLSAMLLAYGTGYVLRFRTQVHPRLGDAFILLGAILFQAAVFLIGQIYNVPTDDPTLLLLGAVGILPMAYLMSTRFVLFGGLVELVVWLGWRQATQFDENEIAYFLPVLFLGVIVYSVGRLHASAKKWAGFAGVYTVIGLSTVLVSTFVLTFADVWEEMARHHDCAGSYCGPASDYGVAQMTVALLILAAIVTVAPAAVRRFRSEATNAELLVVAALLGLCTVALARPWWALAVPFNVVFFVAALGATILGYVRADNKYIYLGLGAFAVALIARYVETSWDMLPRSGFFVVGGALLMLLSCGLEVIRRRILRQAQIRQEATR